MEQPELFSLTNVTVRRRHSTVLNEVSLRITAGRCTALLGPSGSGKTTLLRLLTRLEEPDRGHITVDGTRLDDLDVLALRRRIQFIAQQPTLLTDTVLDELRVATPRISESSAAEVLEKAALPPETFLHRSTTGLSGGEAQRLCLARGLTLHPDALLLDEPTSALDDTSADAIAATVRRFTATGGSVVLVSHDNRIVDRLADEVFILDNGHVAGPSRTTEIEFPRSES
ncbi:ATP-binding cassette domain-containing protein [Saccharopolyspora sp. K220]|uniref:ABC transporter ATP-binding protein n=1 Tax=Saccharopolyspora soli TaxID=2926618 RepID=UPI001F561BFD|nr:ATP-binding cassette domain-containing protein [Saccharopolyspora soli]MCI2419775.1 ATP-binding cassette domain-containing protein [Saccharopolyspora soli]